MITDAIRTARTEHIVYFLLTAYVETFNYYDPARSYIPESVKRLPVRTIADVGERLATLRTLYKQQPPALSHAHAPIEEAIAVFASACERLKVLQHTELAGPILMAASGVTRVQHAAR